MGRDENAFNEGRPMADSQQPMADQMQHKICVKLIVQFALKNHAFWGYFWNEQFKTVFMPKVYFKAKFIFKFILFYELLLIGI